MILAWVRGFDMLLKFCVVLFRWLLIIDSGMVFFDGLYVDGLRLGVYILSNKWVTSFFISIG